MYYINFVWNVGGMGGGLHLGKFPNNPVSFLKGSTKWFCLSVGQVVSPAPASGFRVVCLRESSNPPSSPVSALVGSQPSARRPWGGPSRRDAPRFQISLMCLSCLSDRYKLVSTGEEGCPQVSKLASDKCRVFFLTGTPLKKLKHGKPC